MVHLAKHYYLITYLCFYHAAFIFKKNCFWNITYPSRVPSFLPRWRSTLYRLWWKTWNVVLAELFTLKQFKKQRFLKQTQLYPTCLLKVAFIYFICLAWQFPSFVLDGGGYFKMFLHSASILGGKPLFSVCSFCLDVELYVFFPLIKPFPPLCYQFSKGEISDTFFLCRKLLRMTRATLLNWGLKNTFLSLIFSVVLS